LIAVHRYPSRRFLSPVIFNENPAFITVSILLSSFDAIYFRKFIKGKLFPRYCRSFKKCRVDGWMNGSGSALVFPMATWETDAVRIVLEYCDDDGNMYLFKF
jgi:hypothetical protein